MPRLRNVPTASPVVPAMRVLPSCLLVALLAAPVAPAMAQVSIVNPGAPGEAPRELSADEAVKIAASRYSPADVRFMQDMVPHHHQALELSALVGDRTNSPALVEAAGRIEASQRDEIEFMQGWLKARGERVPDPTAHAAMHAAHKMAGMVSPEDMAALARLEGTAFERQFLQLMINHHAGALKMVEELLEQRGSASDPTLYEFVTDVSNDQAAEIERMTALLATVSSDARTGLSAGFRDAAEAISNLRTVASLPKPAGFFDPENPAGLPLEPEDEDEDEKDEEALAEQERSQAFKRYKGESTGKARSGLLSFANTDMAFSGDVLVVGNYHGFNAYRLGDDGVPALVSSVVCPGGQGDVSIVGDLLLMSVEETRGRLDCGLQGVIEDVSAERFRGLRVFDISDLARPRQVGAVQTCRGSHTHSVVSSNDKRIVVYNSGTSSVREQDELDRCIDELPGDERTALFRIDVIEIPVADPSKARIVDSPAVFADDETGALAGLWRGGDHGEMTQETNETDHCHDITVFPEANIAAGACSGNGILFDISDPMKPTRIDAVTDPGFAYWHSATFNNDGTKVLFTDEWGGGGRPRCRASDPRNFGANAIYDIVDGKLVFRSYFKIPAPQSVTENCVAHNGSVVPVPGRDVFVQAWYQGGLSVIDFTDSANPVEIAYFDRGPVSSEELVTGGFWSVYYYDGRIYGSEITRGLDVLALAPSDHLTDNEIAAAAQADDGAVFNPQQQFPVTWPHTPVVAAAYVDQLARDGTLDAALESELREALDAATTALDAPPVEASRAELARRILALAGRLSEAADGSGKDSERRAALVAAMKGVAARLR
ncbi:DUF305 domain-containing protein [Novilysobacter selenitireducens]|uniref:DUF305 domain-containing protein n=1 Tax=Novilysobacter selenitireducens TaxID=2872639 RepID=A0ABS7T4N1_9GAMM|nr:DUF305 domain-containing protein [Lysobacter selenitireducens]MBZ4038846.1 DUF305 domain-containing protein [Lysobacter selenitireducens]